MGAFRCFKKLLPSDLCTIGRCWNTPWVMVMSPNSIACHFQCWEGPLKLAFWIQFESQPQWNWHKVWPISGWQVLSEPPPICLICQYRLWNTSAAKTVFRFNVPSIFHAERVPETRHFVRHLRTTLGGKQNGVKHNGLVDTFRSSSHLIYTSKVGFETLQQ